MLTAEYNKNGTMRHSAGCKMAFGKKDSQCPRCVEMVNGAAPRAGWQKDHYTFAKQQERSIKCDCDYCTKKIGLCTYGT